MKKIDLSIAAALLVVTNIYAMEDLGVVSVTSSSFNTKENKATFSTEIYTQKEIQNSKAKDIYDFFNSQTSIISMPNFGNPFTQKIDLRGYGITDGYQNVVINVNGRKLNNLDMVPQLLSSISLEDIERIEIIKGSGSVEHGDGANAGVVNITTKAKNNNFIKTYLGNNSTKNGVVSLGYMNDKVILNGFIDYYKTDGNREINTAGDTDEKYNKNKNISLIYFPNDNLELRLKRSYSNMNTKYANSLTEDGFYDDPKQVGIANWSGETYTEQYLSSYTTEIGTTYHINNDYNFDIDYSDEDKLSKFMSGFESNYKYKSVNSKFNIEKDNYKLSLGVQNFDGDRIGNEEITSKNNLGYFLSSEYNINNQLTSSFGIRKEKVKYRYTSDEGSSLSDRISLNAYNIGLNYSLDENNSFFINYNKSFQTPDIDRFFSGGWGGAPKIFNTFIEPVKVKTFNFGYNNFTHNNKLKISLFRSDLQNEIYYNNATFTNTNIDESHKYGIEVFDKYQLTKSLFSSINYNYIVAKIDKEDNFNGNDLPGVPKHNITLSLGWKNKNLSSILTHSYRSKAFASNDFSNNATQKQKAYNSTDLSLSYDYQSFEFFTKIQNIFDKKNGIWVRDDAIYPVNFERTYYAGVKYNF